LPIVTLNEAYDDRSLLLGGDMANILKTTHGHRRWHKSARDSTKTANGAIYEVS